MQYMYILADFDEYGLNEPIATVNRASLPVLLERFVDGFHQNDKAQARNRLTALLLQPDEELSTNKHDLMAGWGGAQLYVLKLQ